ncbi:coiled-coil domain containing protein, putative [Entamoeba invadens IP1]|uniref:Coiled-coil domain containing protein, putative n=1 Tax=Entamoeba invadens IP1 TaxID=370355 RepID=A0A0A1TYX9_ENTIV|nr:coiled-coil domain containing protein, putative [Entamoeba invadens IP1]ELP83736.1 coiled-coil domain containing protein, putative [Entamoeba invadens IP1]|eukprot:XP_004183082.1 coiled-coil domain containing protein, putative [Entamoeba invadens IP1]
MRSTVILFTLVLLVLSSEVVKVTYEVSHKDRKELEKKAEQRFAVEFLRIKKHQDHLKQHLKKKISVFKANKETYQKVRDTTLNEKKEATKVSLEYLEQIKALDLEPAKVRLEAKKNNKTMAEADQLVSDAVKKAIGEKLKLSNKQTKNNLKVEKIAKRLQHYENKINKENRHLKRAEFKLTKLHAKIASTKTDLDTKKKRYVAKRMRQLERIARVKAIKKMIKKIEKKLDNVENEGERKKLINKQKVAKTMLVKIEARVNIHKTRKAQKKARWNSITATIKNMNRYIKGWKYDQKLRILDVAKATAQVNGLQKSIETIINQAKKTHKVDTVELQKVVDKKSAAMNQLDKVRTELEEFQEKGEKRIRVYQYSILRQKMNDAKIRISQHRLSKDAAKVTKKEYMTRIQKLNKLKRRMGLCPMNRLRIKRRLRVYKKEVKIATGKIRRNNKKILRLENRLSSLERRFRKIQKKRIAKIVITMSRLKGKLNHLRQEIMAIRVRKQSGQKEILLVKMRNLQIQEKQVKNTLKRYHGRNGHVLRKLETIRKEELAAAKKFYKDKKKMYKRVKVVIKRLTKKVEVFSSQVKEHNGSPFKQVKMMRKMKKYVNKLEKAKELKKSLKIKKDTARSKYEVLKTKAINRLHTRRSQMYAEQTWKLSELRQLAKSEKDTTTLIKKTTDFKTMKSLNKELKYVRKDGKMIQLELYKLVKKISKVNQLFVRHSQYTAIRRAKVIFKKYNKKYLKFELKKNQLKRKMAKYQDQLNEIFKKQPYVTQTLAKAALNDRLRLVKTSLGDLQTDYATAEKQQKRLIVRTLRLSKEYFNLLNVKLSDLKTRLGIKQQQRPVVSKKALYTINPDVQKRAIRNLKVIDSDIEDLDHSIDKTQKKINKTAYVINKLKAALKPKGKKCMKQTDCKICRKLGKVAKYGITRHESDSIILNRLRGVCTRIAADRQKECYHQAMNMAMKALHTFDPAKFEVTEVCTQLGKC